MKPYRFESNQYNGASSVKLCFNFRATVNPRRNPLICFSFYPKSYRIQENRKEGRKEKKYERYIFKWSQLELALRLDNKLFVFYLI